MTPLPHIRGLLLDAVGTLIRLHEPPPTVYVRFAERHGLRATPEQVAERFRAHRIEPPPLAGVPLSEIAGREREGWREIVRDALGPIAADGPCFDELFDFYAGGEAWHVEPGAAQALAHVRVRGVQVAVVSNMDARLPHVLEVLGLAPLIDLVALPSNTGFAKPDPRIFRFALERLGVEARSALYIGDREADCVDAARKAGLRGLRYAPGGTSEDRQLLGEWSMLEAHMT
jgi:REG-2-like HAD superfamily hydrolase